ncbi:MAG TPA: hypothetical protein VF557_17625 [Jatrophihabitans sp.]
MTAILVEVIDPTRGTIAAAKENAGILQLAVPQPATLAAAAL